ncbi:hypothetical protein SAMN05660690_3087 [Geodermatophilus telluris]|uniref:Antibiotic biosynthesis monooxygenase n=1 Tax=Geodermatophilus telluris TaxID=1190417 RepID=A0A1G6QTX6_9ACTN|nr:hypothetical protein [Geodermatophilus telluris]SDC95384.1 hypothetical protein SAMN05660690_3087 [Geodermatophilus telluris]
MTYAVTMDVAEAVELYDAFHRLLLERTGGAVDGLLVHLARQTVDGFQVVEVWESREDFERCTAEVVGPLATELLEGRPRRPTVVTEFEVRGLVLPRSGVAV